MDWTKIAFETIGGLGLFLMGMKIMSEGMQKAAGEGLRKILNFLTANRFMAIGVGFLVTAIIQSSSATTVMMVGFVNAGLMSLQQGIGVVLGANVGTTVTGWIVTLKIVKYAMPMIGVGVGIRFFSRSQKWRYIGEVIFGFGILFLGMVSMKQGFAPLRESPDFEAVFRTVDGVTYSSVLMGVVIGTITTLVVQSSSAIIGITIALASQGILNFEGSVAIILGTNIGTTITAILASIGTNFHAKRAAIAHTLFNVLGVVLVLIVFYPFTSMIERIIPDLADFIAADGTKPFIGHHIAMAHTIFNFANVAAFVGFVPFLAKVCEKIVPEPKMKEGERVSHFSYIDYNLVDTPTLGIAETQKELVMMSRKVHENAERVKIIVESKKMPTELCETVLKDEQVIDELQRDITEFMVSMSATSLSENDATLVGNYMGFAHNLEKYADYLEHVAIIFDKIDRKNLTITDKARDMLVDILALNEDFFKKSIDIFEQDLDGNLMDEAYVINRRVKKMIKDAKLSHFERLQQKICENEAAIYFVDILNNMDGMRSQNLNIAEVVSGRKYSH